MKTDLSFLPEHKQAELQAIVSALIPRYGEIEMIILFGSYARNQFVEDKYEDKGITYEYKSDYDLLIVMTKNAQAHSDSLTHAITLRLEELNLPTPLNPIFQGIDFVNNELREASYFFGDIKKEGILLFTTSRYQLEEKRDMSAAEIQAKTQKNFDKWFFSANEFFIDFNNALNRQSTNNAAFHLHQATERYYGAIQLVFTGYKPKTHDIEILGKMAKAVNMEFGKVFPRGDMNERRRFMLLKKAYVDARYNMDYTISKDDLAYLSERVQLLRELTETICKQKIESFTN